MLAGMVLLTTQISRSGFSWKKLNLYHVYFKNSSGLLSSSPVEFEGFRVGYVEDVKLEDREVLVRIRVDPALKIYTDSRVYLEARGLLGEKIIQIEGGGNGDLIPDGGAIRAENRSQSFEDAVGNMNDVMISVKDLIKGGQGKASVQDIIENTTAVTESLRKVVKGKDQDIERIVENLKVITESMRSLVGSEGDQEKDIGQSLKSTIEKIDRAASNLDKVMARLERGEGTMGKLLKDEDTVDKLNETLEGVSDFVGGVKQLELGIGFRAEYMGSVGEPVAITSFRLKPAFDKYFLLEFTDGPLSFGRKSRKVVTETQLVPPGGQTKVEEKTERDSFAITALFARRFSFLTASAGLIRSSGGFGLDFHLIKNHLDLGFQAFDFSRNEHPHLRLQARLNLFKIFYLTGGADDILHRDKEFNFFGGAGFILTDDDVKRLLGLAPLAVR